MKHRYVVPVFMAKPTTRKGPPKVSDADVREIRRRWRAGEARKAIALDFAHISERYVHMIIAGTVRKKVQP